MAFFGLFKRGSTKAADLTLEALEYLSLIHI